MSTIADFVEDITPFLYGRQSTYIDLGAYRGAAFLAMRKASFRIREAHLIEPNPHSADLLSHRLEEFSDLSKVHQHRLAISSAAGTVVMNDNEDMSRVVEACPEGSPTSEDASRHFQAPATTFDEFVQRNEIDHIEILKVDVEGHELDVLKGAQGVLSDQKIDIIYIEAGFDPHGRQQAYYRAIEDALLPHGYRLFRLYEQTNEWIVDGPLLRRADLAFMSERFAENNPNRVTKELFLARSRADELMARVEKLTAQAAKDAEASETQSEDIAHLTNEVATLTNKLDHATKDKDAALAEVEALAAKSAEAANAQSDDIARMSAEIVTLTNTLDQSQREKDAALAEVEALAAKSAEAANAQSDEIARMSAEIITLTNTLDQSERAKNAALVDVKALSEDVKKLKEQCARAKASLTELKKSKSSIEKKLIVTRESVSWRVTTPLRIGFRVVKKLLGSRPDR